MHGHPTEGTLAITGPTTIQPIATQRSAVTHFGACTHWMIWRERFDHARRRADPDHPERGVASVSRKQIEERRVAARDQHEDRRVIEPSHVLARFGAPVDAVIERAHAEQDREARAEDERGPARVRLRDEDEHARGDDRREEGPGVRDTSIERLTFGHVGDV